MRLHPILVYLFLMVWPLYVARAQVPTGTQRGLTIQVGDVTQNGVKTENFGTGLSGSLVAGKLTVAVAQGAAGVFADSPLTGTGTAASHLACSLCVLATTSPTWIGTHAFNGPSLTIGNAAADVLTVESTIAGSLSFSADLGGFQVSHVVSALDTALPATSGANILLLSGGGNGAAAGTLTLDSGTSAAGGGLVEIGTANASDMTVGRAGRTTVLDGTVSITNGLSTDVLVSDVLPIVRGGTNSGAALTASAVAVSNGFALVQGPAGTTTTLLHGNAAGQPTYGAVALATEVSGVLPVANGGTNSSTGISGSWSSSVATGLAVAEDTNFVGPFRTVANTGKMRNIAVSWAVTGTGGVTGVVAQVYNATGSVELCSCTLGACTTASGVPLVCDCNASFAAATTYVVRFTSATDCATNPQGPVVNVELTQP